MGRDGGSKPELRGRLSMWSRRSEDSTRPSLDRKLNLKQLLSEDAIEGVEVMRLVAGSNRSLKPVLGGREA